MSQHLFDEIAAHSNKLGELTLLEPWFRAFVPLQSNNEQSVALQRSGVR